MSEVPKRLLEHLVRPRGRGPDPPDDASWASHPTRTVATPPKEPRPTRFFLILPGEGPQWFSAAEPWLSEFLDVPGHLRRCPQRR